jgi:hypothetical protein
MLFKEVISVYTENDTEPSNTKFMLTAKVAGTYTIRL